MSHKVCYTALLSDYEELKDPTVIANGWRYVCFTDQPVKSDIWEIIPIDVEQGLTPQRMARKIKILPHVFLPDAEFTIWIDASFKINVDLNKVWDWFKPPFTAPKHPLRNCVYQEIKSCITFERADVEELRSQEQKYRSLNIPAQNGIITSGLLMRQNTKACNDLCNNWWQEVCENSPRDQIAFARVSIDAKFHTINWDYRDSKELEYFKHYKFRKTA